jgi:hypothetical protein
VLDHLVDHLREIARYRVGLQVRNWNGNPARHPTFLLETPLNNWRDYQNVDIPYYVRRVSEQQLRNSAGDTVDLANAAAALALGLPQGTAMPPNIPQHYFAEVMPTALADRLTAWRNMAGEEFRAVATAAITPALPNRQLGDLALLRDLMHEGQQPA